MREIKFRLRADKDKVVGYEKWSHGIRNFDADMWIDTPKWLYSVDDKYWTPSLILHRYKDAFTGITDKNGKEIYEGDIGINIWDELCEVKFGNYLFGNYHDGFYCIGKFGFHPLPFHESFEIIGNIHENPDLLEEK